MGPVPSDVLRGFTVGVTADRRWDEQASLFERRGATVLHGPSIRTLPLGSDSRLRAATEAVIARRPALLVANTGLGIRSWLSAAETWGLGDDLLAALRQARIHARGPKASGAVHSAGLDVASRAGTERLSEAVDAALAEHVPGQVVALQVDGSGSSPELGRFAARGIEVIEVPVYEWKLPEDPRPALRLAEAVIAGKVHAVTFTTGPAIRNWLALAADCQLDGPLREALVDGRTVVGCVGPVCAEVAAAEGISSGHLVVPAAWRLGPLVRAVTERLVGRSLTARLDGAELVITGTAVTISGEAVACTDIEAKVLAALAAQPGVVVAKVDLLRSVWGDEGADPHLVEVAVNRLRRRLGAHGAAITSVHRRGYLLRG
jgi:uroporphyrinogen-III synthase